MGPLALEKELFKLFSDEARKQELHKIKVAAALKKEGLDKANPEAGPNDTVPAMLTPGEAVIPAPVAQHPAYKGVISELVDKGRQMNSDSVRGYQEGTKSVEEDVPPKLEFIPLTDSQRIFYESGGDPLAKNPNSSAKGLRQMTDAARKDVEKLRPDLKELDYNKVEVQKEYYDVYRGILQKTLQQQGVQPNEDAINKAWVVGPQGYSSIYKADPNTPLSDILSKDAITNNPNLQNKTVWDFVKDPNPYSRKPTPVSREMTPSEQAAAARAAVTGQWGTRGAKMRGVPPPVLGELAPPVPPIPEGRVPPSTVMESSPPPLSQNEDLPLKRTEVMPRDKVLSVEALKPRLDKLEAVNNEPATQEALSALQQSPPPQGTDPKDWLSKGFAKIYGPTGLFNERELLKFSILAAGGVLTGVPSGRAIRFAANQAMASAENRYNQEVASAEGQRRQATQIIAMRQAAQQKAEDDKAKWTSEKLWEDRKDKRELFQKMESDYSRYLSDANPEAHGKAHELFIKSRQAKDPAEREAALTGAIQFLAKNPRDKATSRAVNVKTLIDERTGAPVQAYQDPQGRFMVRGPDGEYIPNPKDSVLVEPTEFDRRERKAEEIVVKSLTSRLDAYNRDRKGAPIIKGFDPKLKAEQLAIEGLRLRESLGLNIDPKAFAVIMENATMALDEELKSGKTRVDTLSPEGWRRLIYANAIIETRKTTGGELYKVKDDKGEAKRPGVEAIVAFADAVKTLKDTGPMKGQKEAEVISWLEGQYMALPKEKKDALSAQARALQGYSPFLLWVTRGAN